MIKEDQAIDEARNELWYASDPKHNVTELEFTAFDCAWEACSTYYKKRITKLEVALKDMKNVAKTCAATLIMFGAIAVSTGVVRLILSVKHWMMR